jgi:ABC-type sugar transport system permease subunit
MHLIIPFAASHALIGPEVWAGLQLPHLQTLLTLLQRQQVLQDPETSALHLPHERLQAQALGWRLEAPTLPWAAWHQAQQGQQSAEHQAWMTPCHWQIGMDQVVMADPAHLHLSDEESQQLLQAMQPFLQEDGLQVTWHSALLWHAQGAMLAGMVHAYLPFAVLPIFTALIRLDPALWEAAADLGARPARVFVSITLPLKRAMIHHLAGQWHHGIRSAPWKAGVWPSRVMLHDIMQREFHAGSCPPAFSALPHPC